MKDIARLALVPGMILAKDIFDYRGELLFTSGTKIDEAVIAKMARHSIMAVSIMEEIDFATTHFEKIRLSEGFRRFELQYNHCLLAYRNAMNNFVFQSAPIDTKFLLDIYYNLASLAPNGNLLLDYLYNMVPNEDELTHTHCLNSALIAGVFAGWLSMSPADRETLILSGFFYDIGKLKLPYQLLWKPGKLTKIEFATMKTHPMLGYEMAQSQNLNPHVLNAIFMHHERCDGTGYPSGLVKDQIDIYARYIAIIDAYEAMTSPRTYRHSLTPLEVIARFEQEGLQRYDEVLLRPILKRIADSQIGLTVKLSDDSSWEIFVINPAKLSKPILKRNDTEMLNLAEHPELEIVSIH